MPNDNTCGRCIFAYFPQDPESGARKWRGICAHHTQTIEQHFHCSCNNFIARTGNETRVGSEEQKGEE